MRLADYVIARLEDAGIGHAFCVAGGGSSFLNDAMRVAKRMRYICTHHEQAAGFAAESYARIRGLGLCVVTSGPGATNAITAATSAWQDHVPVIFISGQVFSGQTIGTRAPGLRTLGVQEVDIIPMVQSITKCAVMVKDPQSIRLHLDRAIHEAVSGRPGPTWIDVPADIQNAQIDPDTLPGADEPIDYRDEASLHDQAAVVREMLRQSKRPLIHIGQGVRLSQAENQLFKFLAFARIPLVTARNGNDLIASEDPLYIGRPGTFAQRGANFAVQACDFYLAIGTRLSLAQTGYNAKDYARNAMRVQVDIDRSELDKDTVPLHYKVQADAGDFLQALNAECDGVNWPDWSGWLARCKAWQEKYPPVTDEQRKQDRFCNSYHLIDVLSDLCGPDDIVVTDVGYAYQNTAQAWRVKAGQRLLSSNGLAPMGWGLPAAIGAAVGSGRRVICITGDGGLMFNAQELATIAHHRLPVKIFLLNNGGYLTMRQSQAHAFDGYMGSDEVSGLSFPDFRQLAAAHGIKSWQSFKSQTLGGDVSECLNEPGPFLLDVRMDPDQPQIPKSINRRLGDGTIKQTAIEDAWPFLPEEEIAEALKVSE